MARDAVGLAWRGRVVHGHGRPKHRAVKSESDHSPKILTGIVLFLDMNAIQSIFTVTVPFPGPVVAELLSETFRERLASSLKEMKNEQQL